MGKTKTAKLNETSEVKKENKMLHKPKVKETSESSTQIQKSARGARYLGVKSKIDRNRVYPLNEAINLVKETSNVKFDATVEMHLVTARENINVQVKLPHSTGKQKKVEFANEATFEKLEKGVIDFDVLLATAETMPKLVKFAKVLGPRGMMPNPKNGTLVKDESAAKNFSTDTLIIKTEKKAPVIHAVVGKVSMSDAHIQENADALVTAVNTKLIKRAFLTSTMGPSVKFSVS